MTMFSKEQLEEIKNSDDFIDFLISKGENADETAALNEYLQNNDVLAGWRIKFAKEDMDKADTYLRGEQEDISYTYEVKPRKQADRALKIKRQGQSDEFELETQGYHPKTGGKRGKATSAKVVMSGDNKQELEISGVLGESIPYVMSVNSNIISVKIEGYDEILFETEGNGHTEVQANVLEVLQRTLKERGAENDTAISWSADLSKVYSDSVYARDFLVEEKEGKEGMKHHLSRISYVYDEKIIHDDEENEDKFVPDIDQVLIQHGAEHPDTTFFMDEVRKLYASAEIGSKEKKFYRTIINTYEMNFPNYLRESDSNGNPRRLNLELIKTEEDVKFAEKFIKALGYEVVADYREHPEKVGFPVRKQKVVESAKIERPVLHSQYVPNIDAALTEHGFGDESFIQELKNRKENLSGKERAFYEAVINAYESNEYQKSPRKNLNEEFIKSEEDVRIAEKIMQDLGFNVEPGKTDYQEENSAKVDFPVREQKIIRDDEEEYEIWYEDREKEIIETKEIDIEVRELSDDSDANEDSLNDLKLDVLLELGYINQALYDEAKKDLDKAMDTLNKKLPMKGERLDVFNDALIDKILDDKSKYAHLAIPSLLADSYKRTKAQLDKEKDEEKITVLQNRRDKLSAKIDNLTDQYASGIKNITFEQYNYDDNMNVADIYDGYVAMLDAREPDVSEERKQVINSVRTQLDKDIAVYDELWGIEKDLSAENSPQLADNHEYLTQQMKEVEITPETYELLSNITFLDEQGKPEPQFIDKDGNDAFRYSEGAQIKEGSKLEAIVDFARNNTIIANLTAKERPSQEDLTQEFQAHIFNDLYAVGKQEQAFRNLQELGKKTTSIDGIEDKEFEDIADKVKASLENPEINWEISNGGYQAAIKTEVNNTLACINRFGKKLGKDNVLLKKLHTPIAKHDPKAKDRFDKENSLKDWGRTFLWSAGSSIAMKMASMGLYKAAGSTISLGASAGIMAAGLSVIGIGINLRRYKKEAQSKGEKPQWGKFFDPRTSYGRTNAASLCAFAAGACLITGQPAGIIGAGIFGVAGVSIMGVSTYKDARNHGATKKEAWKEVGKKLSAVGAGIATGSLLSSWFGAIEGKAGKEPELIKEGTPGYTTHDYSSAEHSWAEMRNNDPRWSEFLERYHVAPDLQSSTDPNSVSPDAMANLKAAITQAIGDNKIFYTDTGNGLQPNTEMLAYKSTQLLYLASDATAITDNGLPIGEVLSYSNPDGSTTNYIEALQQAISNGKVDNPDGFAQMLQSIENAVGGEYNDSTNDMGKIKLFGTHEAASPVQSYNAGANVGYDATPHDGTDPQWSKPVEAVKAQKFWSVGYWEPVKNAFGKMKDRLGGFADKIFGSKKTVTETKIVTERIEHKRKKEKQEDILVDDNKKASENQPFEAKHEESLSAARKRLNGSERQSVNTNKRQFIPITTKQEKVR